MKKFIKENWFKIIISLAVIIITSSVVYYSVVFLPHRDQQISSQQALKINQDNAQKCADQVQKALNIFQNTFNEYDLLTISSPTILGQTNHYNQKLSKCYILIKYKFTVSGSEASSIYYGESLQDAYENIQLASCDHTGIDSDSCFIGENNKGVPVEKYKDFVKQRMELNQ